MKSGTVLILAAVAIVAVLLWPTPGPGPGPAPSTVTAVTFVFDKDKHVVPSPVRSALNKLNRERGIIATEFEVDIKDGTGEVPEQYKVALDAATKLGLPALIVLAGKDVLRTVKDPKTEEQVLEAAR